MIKIKTIFLFLVVLALFACEKSKDPNRHWQVYRGSADASQFSSLTQIDTTNVHLLEPAWVYQSGDAGKRSTIECNPIMVEGILYVTTPQLKMVALNARTGKEIWSFDTDAEKGFGGVNRGVTYFDDGKDGTILFPKGYYLFSLNAKTGKINQKFGDEGKIDLRKNLGVNPQNLSISLTTPGIIYKNLIIIGSATGEGYNAGPGHIRAYNAQTGNFRWIFHTIPQKGQEGYDTWQWVPGENYGGTNDWGGLSLDLERGWVFAATGSASYDFYGANRIGDNLYANCVIALNAETGRKIWHFQTVHHDLWDYDLAAAPNLVKYSRDGEMVDALAQGTKMGTLILLDRETGEPLFPMEERPVPPSYVPGELAAPTQPFNMGIQLVDMGLTEDNLTNIAPANNLYARERYKLYRNEGFYTPPSLEGTVTYPSTRGGMLWSGASYNRESNILYTNVNHIPLVLEVGPVNEEIAQMDMQHEGKIAGGSSLEGQKLYLLNCATCHGSARQGVENAFPALTELNDRYAADEVRQIISQGKGLMPAYPQFNTDELNHLVNFLMEVDTIVAEETDDETPEMAKYVLKGFRLFLDQEGFPASKPPWGTLNAVDLNSGEILWQVPAGTYPELEKRGLPDTGTQMFGGCVATAGGVVFLGATADERFRAFHARTGKELWQFQLPAGGYATPAVYEVDGKQFVVVAAGGGNRNGTPSGDAYYAFALPAEGE